MKNLNNKKGRTTMLQISKISTFFLLSLIMNGCMVQTNPEPKGLYKAENSEYNKGYKAAIVENAEKWREDGFNIANDALSNYSDEIKSYEAGKKAREKDLLNESKVIAIKNPDGSITLKSLGGDFKKAVNPQDLLNLYKNNEDGFNTINNGYGFISKNNMQSGGGNMVLDPMPLSESFKLPNERYIDQAQGEIKDNKSGSIKTNITLSKSDSHKKIIDDYGLNCNEKRDSYTCFFKNSSFKEAFCLSTGVCQDA